MITVIEQTTAERNQETMELFNNIRPYLDQGYTYRSALNEVGRIRRMGGGYYTQAWFRELIEYGEKQGYPYKEYKGRPGRKKKSENFTTVIERTTKDIDQETRDLFNECRPYLDQGYGFYDAIRLVKGLPETNGIGSRSWYKRFREYAKSQGYKPLRGKNK